MSDQPALFDFKPVAPPRPVDAVPRSLLTGYPKGHIDYVHEVGQWLDRNVPREFQHGFFRFKVPAHSWEKQLVEKERVAWCNGISHWCTAILIPCHADRSIDKTAPTVYIRPERILAKWNQFTREYEPIAEELRARWMAALQARETHPGFKWTGTYAPLNVPDLPLLPILEGGC